MLWRQAVLALGVATITQVAGLAAQQPVAVAVGGFETDGSVGLSRDEYDALGHALAAMLSGELGSQPGVRAITLPAIAGPRPGRVDIVAARAAAQKAGAQVVVIGTMLDQYGDTRLEARLLDPSSGKPVGQVRAEGPLGKREALMQSIADLATRLAAEPALGGRPGTPSRPAIIPVGAMVEFGRGLRAEAAGDLAAAASAYRKAVQLAPAFRQAAEALRRVSG
jgi:hypothetical protein